MYFEVSGKQEIELPDDIDPNDKDAVMDYIEEIWDDIPLPPKETWSYVDDSCNPDRETMWEKVE